MKALILKNQKKLNINIPKKSESKEENIEKQNSDMPDFFNMTSHHEANKTEFQAYFKPNQVANEAEFRPDLNEDSLEFPFESNNANQISVICNNSNNTDKSSNFNRDSSDVDFFKMENIYGLNTPIIETNNQSFNNPDTPLEVNVSKSEDKFYFDTNAQDDLIFCFEN
ncbi:uncharacterized protein LOC124815966 [Hydra vulgaris]|uniref:uncharacterized protein LOC124815966 n=1 Tax=Hydra vulgaris TaxID=6087 RepID=UPI0032EA3CD4